MLAFRRTRRARFRALGLVVVAALLATACSGSATDVPEDEPADESTEDEADNGADADEGEGAAPSFEGTTVELFGAFVDVDADNFAAAMADFEERTGINVDYQGSGDFVTLINTRAAAGNPPDIAFFPTPGLIGDFVGQGYLQPLPADVAAVADENYISSWLDLGTVDGELYGLAYKASVKSLVWYSPSDFADAGYSIPETWDEMMELTAQIADDGVAPWCMGFESGEATGWPGTDWIEDILLRQAGGEVYDQWVANEIPFDDPRIVAAFETFGEIALEPSYVLGGAPGILTTFFGDAQTPMFAPDGPQCYLHRQASFYSSFLPEGVVVGPDADTFAFLLPPIDPTVGTPVMGGGDFAVAFADRPEVMEVMRFLATPDSGVEWARRGGFVSPHSTFDVSNYPEGIDLAAGQALADADLFRFDGSDAMPGPVQPRFWAGVVDYVNGGSLPSILAGIQEAFES